MSTRSRIGLEYTDQIIEHIYCHFDGYIAGVGKTLYENYKDTDTIRKLIKLGSLSALGPIIGKAWDFNDRNFPDQCKAYHRDRNEEWEFCRPQISNNRSEYIQASDNSDAEYIYLWS